jgi:hypothetical protein
MLAAGNNLKHLDWLPARATRYLALASGGSRFPTSAAAPVLDGPAWRGPALIESERDDLAAVARALGLPHTSTPPAIDEDRPIRSSDSARAGLEAEVLQHGSALGIARGYPGSLERLRFCATALADKGLVLALVRPLAIERAGFGSDGQTASRSQG